MNEQNGVRYEYIGTYRPDTLDHPDAIRCGECERWFVASIHYNDGEQDYCPECHAVESIGHSMKKTLEDVDPEKRPRDLISVEDL